ncbi:MAG: TRAP transporter large permease [Clostridiaceae bacterium]|nr:TRAP transporter large permease [Clostridiaceae bacterium]
MTIVIGFVLIVILLILGVPVFYCFGTAALLYTVTLGYTALGTFPTMYGKLASVVLISIPMFIMAGGIMEKGRIGDALIGFVEMFLGKIKGCLAIVACVTSAIFGSISGSGAATLSCIGGMILPRMKAKGYDIGKSAAVICCSAPLGLLIPPSAGQIMIAWIGNLSVLACFLSTVIPGIILTILLSITSYFMFRKDPGPVKAYEESIANYSEMRRSRGARTKFAIPALFMPFMILGGIYGGIMTPTEAAAVAVFYCIPVSIWVYKGATFKDINNIFIKTAVATGTLMVMIAIMMVISQILVMENIPNMVFESMTSITDNPKVLLLIINIFMVFVGMIMDDCSGIMLCSTLLLPMISDLGVSPYTMSAIIGVNLGMGNITPPTAPFLYIASKIANVDSMQIMKYCFPFLIFGYVPTLILTTYVPVVTTWLPRVILGIY